MIVSSDVVRVIQLPQGEIDANHQDKPSTGLIDDPDHSTAAVSLLTIRIFPHLLLLCSAVAAVAAVAADQSTAVVVAAGGVQRIAVESVSPSFIVKCILKRGTLRLAADHSCFRF